jgi:hypothetical protein
VGGGHQHPLRHLPDHIALGVEFHRQFDTDHEPYGGGIARDRIRGPGHAHGDSSPELVA